MRIAPKVAARAPPPGETWRGVGRFFRSGCWARAPVDPAAASRQFAASPATSACATPGQRGGSETGKRALQAPAHRGGRTRQSAAQATKSTARGRAFWRGANRSAHDVLLSRGGDDVRTWPRATRLAPAAVLRWTGILNEQGKERTGGRLSPRGSVFLVPALDRAGWRLQTRLVMRPRRRTFPTRSRRRGAVAPTWRPALAPSSPRAVASRLLGRQGGLAARLSQAGIGQAATTSPFALAGHEAPGSHVFGSGSWRGQACVDFKGALDDSARRSGRGLRSAPAWAHQRSK